MSLTRTGIPYLDLVWNPCGFGCSKKCEGCWAKRLAPRIGKNIGCKDCAEFKVHFHPERLDDPAKRKKPAVIGVQFTGELFDPVRPVADIGAALDHACTAPQHAYVFLTQQMMGVILHGHPKPRESYWGLTYSSEANFGGDYRWPWTWCRSVPNPWLSLEPLHGPIKLTGMILDELHGVIVGCDNRKSAPFELQWVRNIIEQCKAANVPVYVKQIRVDGKLLHDPADFPEDLRVRELPWTLTTKEP